MEHVSSGAGQQARQQQTIDKSLETTLRRFNEAFNRFDAQEVASFWAENGTVISPVGMFGDGRSGVQRVYQEDVDLILRGTTSRFAITRVRPVGNDYALIDLDHELQNCRKPDGTTGTMTIHVAMLAQRKGDGWQWLDARPYAFLPRPPSVH